jgi:uncharacterized repeat protein (TIGR01451 family)
MAAGVAEGGEPAAAETAVSGAAVAAGTPDSTLADLPVIDLTADGWTAVAVAPARSLERAQAVVPPVGKTAVTTAAPGQEVAYTVTVANSGAATETVTLTDTLPPELALVALDDALTYDRANHRVVWTGEMAPGRLDYSLSLPQQGLPYLDLGDYGLPNLCAAFVEAGEGCDDAAVTFNLGAEGYSTTLYGQTYYQLHVSADGLLLLPDATAVSPHWLPDAAYPGVKLAGLWQDLDMTSGGRWHAAILSGYVAGEEVFYVQWQAAPHAANPDLSSSFAIALSVRQTGATAWDAAIMPATAVAEATATATATAASGSIFYIYGPISQPDALISQGYAIGLQDSAGERGFTYAYAGEGGSPRGTPPPPGTTLHFVPHFYGTGYTRSFQYTARVTAPAPGVVVNTAYATWGDGRLEWATHYLHIRHQQYLPLIFTPGASQR